MCTFADLHLPSPLLYVPPLCVHLLTSPLPPVWFAPLIIRLCCVVIIMWAPLARTKSESKKHGLLFYVHEHPVHNGSLSKTRVNYLPVQITR